MPNCLKYYKAILFAVAISGLFTIITIITLLLLLVVVVVVVLILLVLVLVLLLLLAIGTRSAFFSMKAAELKCQNLIVTKVCKVENFKTFRNAIGPELGL